MNFARIVRAVLIISLGLANLLCIDKAYAAPRVSYIYDKTFKLKNKKFIFNNVPSEDRAIYKMINDANGGVILIGTFTGYSKKQLPRILRLNSNLSIDLTFAPSIDGEILDVALAADGKILIAGDFTTVDGLSRNGIARLLANGAIDPSFDPGTGGNGSIRNITHIMPFTDGSVVIFGSFSQIDGRRAHYSLAKLLPTGAVDSSFLINLLLATLDDGVRRITADVSEGLPGDKILVVGYGSDDLNHSPDGFEGSTVINSDGTRTESIKNANNLLTCYQHTRGYSSVSGNISGFISHELFSSSLDPISETIYRFDSTGLLDSGFKIKKKIYLTATYLGDDGKFLTASQTITGGKSSSRKARITAKSIIERYSAAGLLEATLRLPKIKRTNFEYRNILKLANGALLVHVRTVKYTTRGLGRAFSHYLIKVRQKS